MEDFFRIGKKFGLNVHSFQKIPSGNMKDTYSVQTTQGNYIAQRFKFGNYLNKRLNQVCIIANRLHAVQKGLHYPHFVISESGNYLVENFTVQECLPGSKLEVHTLNNAIRSAEALRYFHRDCDLINLCDIPLSKKKIYSNDLVEYHVFAEKYGFGVIHGDFETKNLLYFDDTPISVLDLDSICIGERYLDFAQLVAEYIETDLYHYKKYIVEMQKAYSMSNELLPAYAALILYYEEYIIKCDDGFLRNKKTLIVEDLKKLVILLKEDFHVCLWEQ